MVVRRGRGPNLSGGQDGSAAVTSWRDGAVTHSWKAHAKPVTRVAHLPRSGDVLTAGRDGLVKLWSPGDAGDAEMRREFVGHDLTVSGLAELEDLGLACSGSRDYTVRAWDLETARCAAVAKISRNVVTNIRRVPREPVVAQTSEDLRVRLWDVRDLQHPRLRSKDKSTSRTASTSPPTETTSSPRATASTLTRGAS